MIAADTFGVLDGKILGKPHTEVEAAGMLALLSGRSHTVITGFTVLDARTGRIVSEACETIVCFRNLSKQEITRYVATGEPLDKAGAYAIQGQGSALIEKIDGDYFNVVGLPLDAVARALKEFGIRVIQYDSGGLSL